MFRNRPVSLALVGLFVWVTACASYKQIEPAQVADYDEVRVTFSDGEQLGLKDVTVEGDSIHYWEKVDKSAQYSAGEGRCRLDDEVNAEAAGTSSSLSNDVFTRPPPTGRAEGHARSRRPPSFRCI